MGLNVTNRTLGLGHFIRDDFGSLVPVFTADSFVLLVPRKETITFPIFSLYILP